MSLMSCEFVALVVLSLVSHSLQKLPEDQYTALTDLYQATDGESWTENSGWLSGDPCEDSWYGVVCDNQDASVIGLLLRNNNLDGTLPESSANLTTCITMYEHPSFVTYQHSSLTNLLEKWAKMILWVVFQPAGLQ